MVAPAKPRKKNAPYSGARIVDLSRNYYQSHYPGMQDATDQPDNNAVEGNDPTPGKYDDPVNQRPVVARNYAELVTTKAQAEQLINGKLSPETASLIRGLDDARKRQDAINRGENYWQGSDGKWYDLQGTQVVHAGQEATKAALQGAVLGTMTKDAQGNFVPVKAPNQWFGDTVRTVSPPIAKALEIADLGRATVASGVNQAVKGFETNRFAKDVANAVLPIPKLAHDLLVKDYKPNNVGFVEGIKRHIGGAQILGQYESTVPALNNKYVRMGAGMGLDTAMDPFMYAGGEIVRGASTGAAEGRAAREASLFIRSAEGKARLIDLRDTFIRSAVPPGGTVTRTVQSWAKGLAEKELVNEVARDFGLQASQMQRGRIELRLLGRPVASSEKLYEAAAAPGRLIAKTKTGGKILDTIGEVFDASHGVPWEVHRMDRRAQSAVAAEFAAEQERIAPIFNELSKTEFESLVAARMEGRTLPGLTAKATGKPLNDYLDEMGKLFDRSWVMKQNTGRYNPVMNPGFDRYFPAYWKESANPKLQQMRDAWTAGRKQWVHDLKVADEDLIKALASGDPKAIAAAQTAKITTEAKGSAQFNFHTFKSLGGVTDNALALQAELAGMYSSVSNKRWIDSLVDNFGVTSGKASIRLPDGTFRTVNADPKLMTEMGMILKTRDPMAVGSESWRRYLSKDTWFPEDVVNTFNKVHDIAGTTTATDLMAGTVSKALNAWKFSVTAMNPGHHTRNLAGDIIANWLDGVVTPKPYYDTIKIMRDPANVSLKIGSRTFTGDEILAHYAMSGAKTGRTAAEHTLLGNKGEGFVHGIKNLSEAREDYARLSHFIDAWRKEAERVKNPSQILREARDAAAERVIKYNHDFMDITALERAVSKWAYPFYTWNRKNLPLMLDTLLLKPGKFNQAFRVTGDLMDLLNVDTEGHGNPLSVFIPKWLRDTVPFKIANETDDRGSLYVSGSVNPMNDLLALAGGGRDALTKMFIGNLGPHLRIPYEQITGQRLPSGQQLGSNAGYATDLLPITRLIKTLVQDKNDYGSPISGWKKALAALNWATGAGVQEVSEKSKQAEITRQMKQVTPGKSRTVTDLRREAYNRNG